MGATVIPTAIVADDLTGAMDTGVQLLALGAVRVQVASTMRARRCGSAAAGGVTLVVNTQSRGSAPAVAAARVQAACTRLLRHGQLPWFKKLDSTLRGNVGAELAAAHAALGEPVIVCAPAVPALGRTVIGGVLTVDGAPVLDTPYRDEIAPGDGGSEVAAIVRRQWPGCRIAVLAAPADSDQLAELLRDEVDLIVADAATDADLAVLAGAAAGAAGRPLLWAGAAGLLRALAPLGAGAARLQPLSGPPAGGDRAGGDRAGGDRAGGDRAGGDRAGGDRAGGDRAGGDRAKGHPSSGQPPSGQPSNGHASGGYRDPAPQHPVPPAAAGGAAWPNDRGVLPNGHSESPISQRVSDRALPPAGPLLVVSGSQRQLAREQVANLQAEPPPVVALRMLDVPADPRATRWLTGSGRGVVAESAAANAANTAATANTAQAAARGVAALRRGRDLVLEPPPARVPAGGGALVQPRPAVAAALGGLVYRIITALTTDRPAVPAPPILVLVGGDTTYACLRRLGIAALDLFGEVEPYVPWGRPAGGHAAVAAVVTKAGGFGDPYTLRRIRARLHQAPGA